jgi:adenylate kinase family enzyme
VQPAIMTLGSTLGSRVVIIGNSGSGKSTLAKSLARGIGAPAIDLDPIHWQDKVGVKRDETLAIGMVVEVVGKPRWIIEGVYGWLAAAALPFATSLIWLDLPWTICSEGLSRRGPWKDAAAGEHEAFLQWAEAYWQRQTPTSFSGHLALFQNFAGPKQRIQSREEIDALLATAVGAVPGPF